MNGPPRSVTNTNGDFGASRRSFRNARSSSPRIGCVLGFPFLTRRTCKVAEREVDLIPSQVADFRSPQAVSIGNEEHRRVAVAVPIALYGLDELFNLGLGQMLSAAKLTVRPT